MDKLTLVIDGTTIVDLAALIIFLCCWIGYRYFADCGESGRKGLIGVTHEYRLMWAMETLSREHPIACASLTANLMKSVSFYASTTIYIIAGLFALIGTIDRLEIFTSDLPFASESNRNVIEIKIMLLLVIFIVAYFKFTWSLRQFNFLCILIGGAPHDRETNDKSYWENSVKRMARVNSQAGNEFNRGIRAYYYGIACLAWFINPWLFIVATLWITWVLYRRDFRSDSLKVIRDQYPPEFREIELGGERFSVVPNGKERC